MSDTVSQSNDQDESRLNVLIIDDNEQITKMISSFLDMSNHDCTVVNEGKEGLELIKTKQYDSIVLDLAMPEFDGYLGVSACLQKPVDIDQLLSRITDATS
jgi:DNA-binding response OmpR family regulator